MMLNDSMMLLQPRSAAAQPIHRSVEQPEPGNTREYYQSTGNAALIVGLQSYAHK